MSITALIGTIDNEGKTVRSTPIRHDGYPTGILPPLLQITADRGVFATINTLLTAEWNTLDPELDPHCDGFGVTVPGFGIRLPEDYPVSIGSAQGSPIPSSVKTEVFDAEWGYFFRLGGDGIPTGQVIVTRRVFDAGELGVNEVQELVDVVGDISFLGEVEVREFAEGCERSVG